MTHPWKYDWVPKHTSRKVPQKRAAANLKVPREREPDVIAAYAKLSARKVGGMFGISHQAVLDIVRKNGGMVRPHGVGPESFAG